MTPCNRVRPLVLFLGGLLGASGVALAAAATHAGDEHLLGNASTMSLAHAPALVALYIGHRYIATATVAGLVLGLGTLLFAGDLVARHLWGTGLFPMAAPAGGMAMIAGWLIAAAGAFFRPQANS